MIYTLEYITTEARKIVSSWNGEDATFNVEGTMHSEGDVDTAQEVLEKVRELEALMDELGI